VLSHEHRLGSRRYASANVVYVIEANSPKGAVDLMTPRSHLVHLSELALVPSSVGSAHRAQSHSKNLVRERFSRRSIVGSRDDVYDENSSSPFFRSTAARTMILRDKQRKCTVKHFTK